MLDSLFDNWVEIVRTWGPEPASLFIAKLVASIFASLLAISHQSWKTPGQNVSVSYDFIVVGSGLAGAAVANQLSADGRYAILVLEAGPDPPLSSDIPYLTTQIQRTKYDWGFQTVPQENACKGYKGGTCYWPRGKMLGGSSMLTSMVYVTGNKKDYNRWKNLGNPGWGWEDVRPYFDLFRNIHAINSYESTLGSCCDITNYMKDTLIEAASELDFKEIKNPSDAIHSKIGYVRAYGMLSRGMNNHAGKMFLQNARSNIHILKNAFVTNVRINPDTLQTEGVNYILNGVEQRFVGVSKEVILTAGAVNNPKILMLSGVGPREHLEQLDIPLIKHIPGVGQNLHDHVSFPGIVHKIHKTHCNNTFDETLAAYSFLINRQGPLTSIGTSNILGIP